MKSKTMTAQTTSPKEVLIQFKVPEDVAFLLRISAAKEKFSSLAKFMNHVALEIVAKQ